MLIDVLIDVEPVFHTIMLEYLTVRFGKVDNFNSF